MSLFDQFAGKYVRYKTVASQPWTTGKVLCRRHEDDMVLYIEPISDGLGCSDQSESRVRFGYEGCDIRELAKEPT